MKFNQIVFSGIIAFSVFSCQQEHKKIEEEEQPASSNTTVLAADLEWQMLNPARGDKSPKAATIWGDRNGTVPTGFLVKFVKGFSSPPHIHNVTYRAMVIEGLVHNDDENADKMWMQKGSFWTQPAGAAHITAANDSVNIVYVEIDKAPYLVKPIEEAFDNGERPINVDKSNYVWLDSTQSTFIQNKAQLTFLWEHGGITGSLIKLPAGFHGSIRNEGSVFHAIVIEGEVGYKSANETESLNAGSSFHTEAKSKHQLSTTSESIIYIRTNDHFKITK